MSTREKIQADLKTAMKARDQERVTLLRFVLAAIKQREVDERKTLTEAEIIAVIEKQVKQRRESIKQYQSANRQDLADKEQQELSILLNYLPEPLSEPELTKLIDAALAESGAKDIKDMGKVMAILKPQVQGRADMKELSNKIREKLGL
ncbi:MAG: GatB/YqeY domain-containing protein [Pseudomonadota bacterium]